MPNILDPVQTWELENPEPEITFRLYEDGKHRCTWNEMIAHVIWTQKRMEAYRKFEDQLI